MDPLGCMLYKSLEKKKYENIKLVYKSVKAISPCNLCSAVV